MFEDIWLRQENKALFEDLLWSRPQNKAMAGKLLIIGGHKNEIQPPVKAFELATLAGIGKATLAVPDSLPPAITSSVDTVSLPSSKSGGISTKSKDDLAAIAANSDAVLWPGALGRDSESTQLLGNLAGRLRMPQVFCGDAADAFIGFSEIGEVAQVFLVITLQQLRSLNIKLGGDRPITHDIQLTNLIEILAELTADNKLGVMTLSGDTLVSAYGGRCVTTKPDEASDEEDFRWRLECAAASAVLLAQFSSQPLEALATAAWLYKKGDYEK